MLYHLLTEKIACEKSGDYRPPSLGTEGFIHLSFGHQVEWVANQFLQSAQSLWVAEIDPAQLDSQALRNEDPGVGQEFPHLYGPLPFHAIKRQFPLSRGGDGTWKFATS